MRIHELSADEYAIIIQPLMRAKDYIKDPELGKQVTEAIQILKKSSKGKSVPSGGSSYYYSSKTKQQKIKELLQSFGIDKRIGR